MLADGRRDFRLTFGMEQGQTYTMGDIPHAAAAPEEEEFAPVRHSELEDKFAVNIVDLALLAVQDQTTADLDRTIWDTVTSSVKTAVKVIHNVEKAESLADHFAMEDRLEAKTNAHAGELVERAKAHLEHVATDPRRPVKVAAITKKKDLIKKRKTVPSAGPGRPGRVDAWRLREPAEGRGAPRAEVHGPAMPWRGAPAQGDQSVLGGGDHAADEAAGADPADPPADVGGAPPDGGGPSRGRGCCGGLCLCGRRRRGQLESVSYKKEARGASLPRHITPCKWVL